MKFKVLSRKMAENNLYLNEEESNASHIIISITSDIAYPVQIKEGTGCKGIIRFNFDDISRMPKGYETLLELFTDKHAKEILSFVNERVRGIKTIIAHCDAGVSRSSATAAALSKILNNKDDIYFKNYVPNMRVYTEILKEYFLNEENYTNMWRIN